MVASLTYWHLLLPATAVVAVVLGAVLPWTLRVLLAPLKVRAARRIARRPRVEPTRAETLSPEFRDFVHRALRQFAAEGFEVAANVSLADSAPDGTAVELLLVNRATGDLGTVVAAAHRPTGARSFVLAVRSVFEDGGTVMTACGNSVGAFPKDPRVDDLTLEWSADVPHARDARALCEAHRRRMQRLGRAAARRVAPAPGEEMAFWQRQWERELERCERIGHQCRARGETDVNRLTFKGACVAAWGQAEPLRAWRIRRRDRRGRRAWAALGMGDWTPPAGALNADEEKGAAAGVASPVPTQPPPPVGEIHFEPSGDGTAIVVGAPTTAQFITGRWTDLATMAVLAAFAGYHFFAAREQDRLAELMAAQLPPGTFADNASPLAYLACLAAVLLAADAYGFLRDLAFARRGPVTLAADPAGLSYRNASAWRGHGRVAREDLDTLTVRPVGLGLLGRTYQLELRRHGSSSPSPLLFGADAEALQTIRSALTVAMGIEPPPRDDASQPRRALAA